MQHCYRIFSKFKDCYLWNEAIDEKCFGKGKPFTGSDCDQLLGLVGAVTHIPAICFSEELIQAYPEAEVVLVKRDIGTGTRALMIR